MKNIKYLLIILISIQFNFSCCQSKVKNRVAELSMEKCRDGDFLFVSSDLSSFDEAITSVTKRDDNLNFSHVGLVHCTENGIFVIEAITKGVCYTPLNTFLYRNSNSTIQIARLKTDCQKYIPQAIAEAITHIGKKYDFAFDMTNNDFYCSELLYFAFAEASGDTQFFEITPMTFMNKTTNEYHPYWVAYFKELNMDIPEGKPGLNPNGMSLSDKLEWIEFE